MAGSATACSLELWVWELCQVVSTNEQVNGYLGRDIFGINEICQFQAVLAAGVAYYGFVTTYL